LAINRKRMAQRPGSERILRIFQNILNRELNTELATPTDDYFERWLKKLHE